MTTQDIRRTHPLLIGAAIAVILFCTAGIAAIFGWVPGSRGNVTTVAPAIVAQEQTPSLPSEAQRAEPAPAAPLAAPAPVHHSRPKPKPIAKAAPAPQTQAEQTTPVQLAQVPPPPPPPAPVDTVKRVCPECGVVEAVREVEKPGEATGIGAVGGAVAGGVVGNQIGRGRGRDIMTILGAIGGGLAGHQVEKNARKTREYQVVVRFEDGSSREFPMADAPAWRPGDKVRLVNGILQPNN